MKRKFALFGALFSVAGLMLQSLSYLFQQSGTSLMGNSETVIGQAEAMTEIVIEGSGYGLYGSTILIVVLGLLGIASIVYLMKYDN